MGHPKYSAEEISRRGEEIYERQLRDKLEPQHKGRFLVIDIETGEYDIDDDDLKATFRAHRKRPNGAHFGMRVGYEASDMLGAAELVSVE